MAATLADYHCRMPHDTGEVSPADVEALFGRLRAEIRASSEATPASEPSHHESQTIQLVARDEAERRWAITAERGVVRGPGLKGVLAYPIKRLLRPLLRWYVEPPLAEQRQFNGTILRLVDELTECVAHLRNHARDRDQNDA